MLIACEDMSRIQELKMQLSKEFDIKDLGAAQKILRMQIRRDREEGKIWLSQAKYIHNILERFNMDGAKPMPTPLAANYQLSAQQCSTTERGGRDEKSALCKCSRMSHVCNGLHKT